MHKKCMCTLITLFKNVKNISEATELSEMLDCNTPIVCELIDELYSLPECSAGGMCHIVTDDDNIEDHNLDFVMKFCSEEQTSLESSLAYLIAYFYKKIPMEKRIATDLVTCNISDFELLKEFTKEAIKEYYKDEE